jgi:TetR/AcrR family transcriptional regulator, regulator of cefoperazone and chloramphenicol sensitivity
MTPELPTLPPAYPAPGRAGAMTVEGQLRASRSDGAQARERLRNAALRLFAEHGFAKTSIREIAEAAATNIASISYYFGDKAGLYRAAFFEPLGCAQDDIALFDNPEFSLQQALTGLFTGFLRPLKQGEEAQLSTRLRFREMVEPTGLWAEEIDQGVKPYHAALIAVLQRHFARLAACGPGTAAAAVVHDDDDLHRLAFSIVAMAVHLFVGRDIMQTLRPTLCIGAPAIDAWCDRLVQFALAMVQAEAARRGLGLTPAAAPAPGQ